MCKHAQYASLFNSTLRQAIESDTKQTAPCFQQTKTNSGATYNRQGQHGGGWPPCPP